MFRTPWLLLGLVACAPRDDGDGSAPADPVTVRFATFNTSLFRGSEGGLVDDLGDPTLEQARLAAAILQDVRPDVVLLNEVDWDADGEAVRLLREDFLGVPQEGGDALLFDEAFVPTVNTGVASGEDLDGDGQIATTPGDERYGNDALGFGLFPGQYGLVVLSRYPIDRAAIRTFRELLWKDVPGAHVPEGYYSDDALDVLRLSSKTHADVPIEIGDETVHFLVSHPTPPSFDGSEDKNGRRNHDEITFWADYIDAGPEGWPQDDEGGAGGLGDASFVIAGDLNADPQDGDSADDPVDTLLAHPRVTDPQPQSDGATQQAEVQGGANDRQDGDPSLDTADFNDATVGNLRTDYVLPSDDLPVEDAGVFWPDSDDPRFEWVGTFPFPVSDHRLVWVDVTVGAP